VLATIVACSSTRLVFRHNSGPWVSNPMTRLQPGQDRGEGNELAVEFRVIAQMDCIARTFSRMTRQRSRSDWLGRKSSGCYQSLMQ
jgi:hypothetical protein